LARGKRPSDSHKRRPAAAGLYGGGVTMLGPRDRLPRCPQRVLVAGTSGAGKTSVARRLGQALALPQVEIDSLYHGPCWTPRGSFVAEVEAFTAEPRWVTEWQYHTVRALLAERADLVVWLDLPRATVMRQVITRTLRRRVRRQVLWNGNVEPPLRTILTDGEHIIRWAWTTHAKTAERVAVLHEQRPELTIVRLESWRGVEEWFDQTLSRHRSS
jgi:adenylate kinase family enzyme